MVVRLASVVVAPERTLVGKAVAVVKVGSYSFAFAAWVAARIVLCYCLHSSSWRFLRLTLMTVVPAQDTAGSTSDVAAAVTKDADKGHWAVVGLS